MSDPEVTQALRDYQAAYAAYRDTPEWRRIRKARRWKAAGRTYDRFISLWREREQTPEDRMAYEAAAARWAR